MDCSMPGLPVHHQLPEFTQTHVHWVGDAIQKDLNDPDNHNRVITGLELDNMECEVKWALGSIITNKASGGDGILVELFQILKDDVVKVSANLENSAVATGLEKVSFHSNP